jgi:hypothetical protein
VTTWIPPWRPSARLRAAVWSLANAPTPLVDGPRWIVSACLLGTLPPFVGFAAGHWFHQPFVGLALAALVLPCFAADRFFRAAGIVATVVGFHSAIAIGLSAHDPVRAAAALSGSDDYWRTTWEWIRHDRDDEYRTATWLPRHAALVGVGTVFGYTSFGAVPFVRGIEEIDLMNHYVGRLVRASQRPEIALLCGWHPWSFVRGLAFLCLVFEVTSLSLARFVDRTLSTRRRRLTRWIVGLSLVILDGAIKVAFAPVVRARLFDNLSAEALTDTG